MIADQDYASLSAVPYTTIKNFSKADDSIVFNGAAATAANFTSIATAQTTPGGLYAALDAALDGTNDYVFAVYNGVDINGDGLAEVNLGVLAMDDDGTGITTIIYLPGVVALTPADIAS
jgi:hypothetical protein